MRNFALLALAGALTQCVTAQANVSVTFDPPPASQGAIASSSSSVPNSQRSTLLGNLVWFYEAQRSGVLAANNRVPWRNNSALSDGSDVSLDLTGGYYDAGDYIKATYPLTFTLASICWGASSFGRGYDLAQQTPYLDEMLRWGFDWLIKAHPSAGTLYVQVASTIIDNNYWGDDLDIPTPRPSYPINASAPGTDAAASAASAFAAASYLYSGGAALVNSSWAGASALVNSTYASTLRSHAQELFAFATNTSQAIYSESVPAAAEAYKSSRLNDSLIWGAAWMYLATNDTSYITYATEQYRSSGLNGSNAVFNWDSKVPGIPLLMTQILKSRNEDATTWQTEMERYFDRILDDPSGSKMDSNGISSFLTSGGLLYYSGDSDSASLNPAANAAMLMLQYAPLATTSSKSTSYQTFALSQLDYFLGSNPMNRPYIVGVHPNAPTNPHSAMASGGTDIGDIDNSPPVEAHVLYGAVVGGPSKSDQFFDERSDFTQTEVALDYNAPFLSIAAYSVITNSSDPTYVSLQGAAVVPTRSTGLSTGVKVAIAMSVTFGTLLIGVGFWWCWSARKK